MQQRIATSHPPTLSARLVQQGHSLRKHSTVGETGKNDSRIGRKQRSVCPTSKFRLRDPLSYSLRWTQESLRRNLFGHFQANGGVKRQHQNRFHVLGGRVANLFGQEIQRGPPSRSIFVSMQSLWSPLTNCLKLIVHG